MGIEVKVDIPISTVMIDLYDLQVVLGGKGRWRHQNGNRKTLCDCPNHNLSRLQDSCRTILTSAGWSRGVGGGERKGEEGRKKERERPGEDSKKMARLIGLFGNWRLASARGSNISQRISLSRPRRRAGGDMPVIERKTRWR